MKNAAAALLAMQRTTLPATASAAPAEAAQPAKAVASPEYDAVDIAALAADILAGTAAGFASPHINSAVADLLSPEQFPFLTSKYGKVIPGKVAGVVVGQVGGFVGGVIGNGLNRVLHGTIPGVGEPEPGLGWTPTPPNKMLAGLVKGISTTWLNIALRDALAPPPPPTLVYPEGVEPLPPPTPSSLPPAPSMLMGQPIRPIMQDAAMGILGTAISAFYDQTVGPLVQRAANVITGRSDEPVKPGGPLTPGRIVSGFVDSVLSSLLIRSVDMPTLASGEPTPFAGTLGVSITNGILGAAWSTVYGRGMGTAIENGVNQIAGIRTTEEQAEALLPALEHFTRAATRGVAVGATTYLLGNAVNAAMVRLGGSIGGVGGALVAVAGAALIGSVGGSIVDTTIGPMLGKLGGQIYSWLTGKPAYEQRMEEAAKQPAPSPGPTPGDPVNAPNGNPGTVPAPDAPKAPAAPADGKPKKRKKTGNAAVDRTSPAINVANAKLVQLALKG
ncbi:MAG: hypothetical protein ABI200_06265 [Gaiellales bacterium]